jgi:hypothetical protein
VRHNRGTEIGAACGQLAADTAGSPARAAVAKRRRVLEEQSRGLRFSGVVDLPVVTDPR